MATGTRVEHAQAALQKADAVCFDVDSTVITKEGIDELAAFLGVGDRVAALTASAMGGSVPFHEALAARLDVMRPSRKQLDAMLAAHPPADLLTPLSLIHISEPTRRRGISYAVFCLKKKMIRI